MSAGHWKKFKSFLKKVSKCQNWPIFTQRLGLFFLLLPSSDTYRNTVTRSHHLKTLPIVIFCTLNRSTFFKILPIPMHSLGTPIWLHCRTIVYPKTLPKSYPNLTRYRTIAYLSTWVEDASRAQGPVPYLKIWKVFHLNHPIGSLSYY